MAGLNTGAFTGDKSDGNPYQGDLGKGIAYDLAESNYLVIEQIGHFPRIVSVYRYEAKKLLSHFSENHQGKNGLSLLDMGAGTGICTLELLCQYPGSRVIGVEMSEGMITVAKYKFHQSSGEELLAHANNTTLLSYWERFRQESLPYKEKVQFTQGDIQGESIFSAESIDLAVANQVVHWTDISKSFANFKLWLKQDGEMVWNSASHWYNDARFPALEYGFRFNDFMKYVLDEVGKSIEVKDIYTLSVPLHNLDSIKAASAEHGLITEQVATYLLPSDLQTFVQNHVPIFVKKLVVNSNADEEMIHRLTQEAIAKAINDPHALRDVKHKYDIVPVFRTVKR